VRIRIELCASRGKGGNQAKTYLSRSFTSPEGFEETLAALLGLYGTANLTKAESTVLKRQLQEAMRRSKADIPGDVDLDVLMKKRAQLAQHAKGRFKYAELSKVFERVPLRDFQSYGATVQRYLVQYIVHNNETARTELKRMGLRWRTYKKGKPHSLFGGRKRKRAQKE